MSLVLLSLLLLQLLLSCSFASLLVLNRIAYAQPRCIQGFASIDANRFVVCEGYWGLSRLLHVDVASGAVLKSQDISREIFAEGIAFTPAGELWMLTYTNNRVLRFDLESLRQRADAPTMLAGQGWGLAYDHQRNGPGGAAFIVTNGSNLLSVRDPVSFAETELVPVTYPNGTRLTQLNELELVRVGGRTVLLANVWFAEIIVGIDPVTGIVLFTEDTRALNVAPPSFPANNKLCGTETTNGIAWHEETNQNWWRHSNNDNHNNHNHNDGANDYNNHNGVTNHHHLDHCGNNNNDNNKSSNDNDNTSNDKDNHNHDQPANNNIYNIYNNAINVVNNNNQNFDDNKSKRIVNNQTIYNNIFNTNVDFH